MYNKKYPLGVRNNNPMNLRDNGINWQGRTGSSLGFVVFDSAENGIRAGARVLRTYRVKYGLKSIETIIPRYAPNSENNTAAYIASVSKQTGYAPNAVLPFTLDAYVPLIKAIIYHENGQNPYDDATIIRGAKAGLLL